MKTIKPLLIPFYWPMLLGVLLFWNCNKSEESPIPFKLLSSDQTGIAFSNDLSYTDDFNVYKYRNFYNGGGIAVGDVNNDGLVDLYFSANQKPNELYLNQGNFTFKRVTEEAKVAGTKAWSTGVTMVDVNADGWLDIYVCNSGDVAGDNKQNELFINNQDGTFTEAAAEYGLDDRGFSTHAVFFDYDKDGDLDVYLLNNSYQAIGSFDLRRNERPKRDQLGGDKLMRNENGKFIDVSEESGIYGSVIGFGLGVTVGDVNNDHWEDIFISNDFFERDYLYLNQQNGTFKEVLTQQMKSISGASMGADMADIDNDGDNDIFVTEMLPVDYQRLKSVTTFEDWNRYQYNVKNGYHHQFTRNMLHRNNANGTFSEVGRLAGVEATDWSWGALFFDMNNDGLKDLFVSNGIYKDLTDQDYLQYISNEEVVNALMEENKVNFEKLIDIIPSEKVPNQAFINRGNALFEPAQYLGLNTPSFSNGSVYTDLDNDGDLDLVVNNVNMEAFVYENQQPKTNNYLQLELRGANQNTFALGTQILVATPKDTLYFEQQPARGFQSSVDPRLHIGLGEATEVTLTINWPLGKRTVLENISSNQKLVVVEDEVLATASLAKLQKNKLFQAVLDQPLVYKHQEANFVDFHRERLMYHMCSTEGPVTAQGDINGDGREDLIIPGPKNQATQIFLNSERGMLPLHQSDLEKEARAEHTETLLFDADQDGDLDLYLASGSIELSAFSDFLYDRLYFNDGKGNFSMSSQKFPSAEFPISTGCVKAADIDKDGDLDLFVGERIKIGNYGQAGSGYILQNDGQGHFKDITAEYAPDLISLGMLTDALFQDWDQDGDPDLVVTGEFMGLEIFENKEGRFARLANNPLADLKGWWNTLHLFDVDQDGDLDILAGNHGFNSRFKATAAQPIKLYLNDFDRNGSLEGILTFTNDEDRDMPFALRHTLIDQIKSLKKKFPNYQTFKNADINQIFTSAEQEGMQVLEANTLATTLFVNQGGFAFEALPLPQEAQLSPTFAIAHHDFDGDGDADVVLGGNLYRVKPEVGIYDASHGLYLENQEGALTLTAHAQDFFVEGEVRDIKIIDDIVYVFRSNESVALLKPQK
ncbi:MAG: VCBS repeat-containing protein [Flavobacteriaceae bacterium]